MRAVPGNNECYILALIAVGDCVVANAHCCR
jgi:hypothetical protein